MQPVLRFTITISQVFTSKMTGMMANTSFARDPEDWALYVPVAFLGYRTYRRHFDERTGRRFDSTNVESSLQSLDCHNSIR